MGFVKFASDYAADQQQMQAEADGLQTIVLSNSNVGPNVAGPWADFYKQLSAFCSTPVYDLWRPWLPTPHFLATSGLADSFASQAAQLEGWRQTINAAAGSDVPGGLDPTGAQAASNLASVVKYGAIGVAAVAVGAVALVGLGELGPLVRGLLKGKGRR